MIKFYLIVLNDKIFKYTSFLPKVFILTYCLISVIRKYKISLLKSNYSFNNVYNFISEEMDKHKFAKALTFPTNEVSKVKWNIGFAIFIYLLITIF